MSEPDWLILNVDDNPAIRYVKTRTLTRAGYRVIEASSGLEGLACVESHRPDLVMCDVKMPDMSGLEVCRRIKLSHPSILVLQVSASFVTTRDKVTGLEVGADSYLTEPVEPEELVAAVRALLRMKRAEDDLRAINSRLETVAARRKEERDRIWTVSSELMGVVDDRGRLVSLNPAWSALLGADEGAVAGRPFLDLIVEDDRAAVEGALSACVVGDTARFPGRLRSAERGERWIEWTATRDSEAWYALGRDATEERARADELGVAQAQLRQAQKMEALGQLTGGIAHDFNNLLTGILGSLELAHRGLAKGRYGDLGAHLDVAHASARRAATLTSRLLVFSRMQSLNRTVVDLAASLRSTADLLRRTLGEKVRLDVDAPERGVLVEVDATQLEIALLNLVLNARDAMPDGGTIEMAVDVPATRPALPVGAEMSLPAPHGYARIVVRDGGTGMPADVLEKAFEPFFTTKPHGQGTGLGLSMVYGFAKQSNGYAHIRSAPGKGTSVELYLPRHAGPAVSEAPAPGPVTEPASGCLLVVEDEADVRSVVVTVLRDVGYHVFEAEDGDAALACLRGGRAVDVMITDIGLPGRNGIEVAREARTIVPGLRVLYMTGYADTTLARDDAQAQQSAMIAKPFDLDAMIRRVGELVRD